MKVGIFTTANEKGQIVIPKEIRDELDITPGVTLNIVTSGKGLYIYPVKDFITTADTENSYAKLLEKTKGSWGELDQSEDNQKSALELKASERRKGIW